MAAPVHVNCGAECGGRGPSAARSGAGRMTSRPGLLGGVIVSAGGTGDGASVPLSQSAARRKFWGWGLEGEGLAASEIERLGAVFTERLGTDGVRVQEP